MPDPRLVATLEADLRRAEQRLRLATARGAWADAAAAAQAAVYLEAELVAAWEGAEREAEPRNIVGRRRVNG